MQKFFKRAFISIKVFWMLVLSLQLMIDEKAMYVNGDSLENLLKIFLTLVERFTLLVRSLVLVSTMSSSGCHPVSLEFFHLYHLENLQFSLCG